jgi:hypothetical protein
MGDDRSGRGTVTGGVARGGEGSNMDEAEAVFVVGVHRYASAHPGRARLCEGSRAG